MTPDKNIAAGTSFSTHRLEALQDALFAIVLTLLVLEFKVPEAHSHAELVEKLLELWPVFLAYVVSFANLSVFWVGQHLQFHYIEKTDRVLLWINLVLMALVSIVPFTTALVSEDVNFQLPYILYGTNLILIGLFSYLNWHYATLHHRLTDHDVSDALVRGIKFRILVAPVLSLVAIGVSFVSMPLSLALYLLLPVYYILPGRVDKHWRQPAVPHEH